MPAEAGIQQKTFTSLDPDFRRGDDLAAACAE
jgi:hypothetical protein